MAGCGERQLPVSKRLRTTGAGSIRRRWRLVIHIRRCCRCIRTLPEGETSRSEASTTRVDGDVVRTSHVSFPPRADCSRPCGRNSHEPHSTLLFLISLPGMSKSRSTLRREAQMYVLSLSYSPMTCDTMTMPRTTNCFNPRRTRGV